MNEKTPNKQAKPRQNVPPEYNPEFATVPAEAEQPSGGDRFFHAFWEIAKTIAIIVLVALFVRILVFQPFFVDGVSMEPTIEPSDYLIINQISYRFGEPKRGDIIVFHAPPEPNQNYIKRVIALPGETVALRSGDVYVTNASHPGGVKIAEPYIAPGVKTLPESESTSWTLAKNEYFVLGDNREPGKSSDSRAWGVVTRDKIIGKAWLRAYPLASFGFIKHQRYPELSLAPASSGFGLQPLNKLS